MLYEGGHSYDGGVLTGRIVYLVPPKRKEGSEERYALRFASTIHPSDDELRLLREQREEHPNSHGQEVEVSALADGVFRERVSKSLRRLGRSAASKENDYQRVAPPQARATLGGMGAPLQGALRAGHVRATWQM